MNIKKINYNEDYFEGCETCDYGSQYINNLEIIENDDTTIIITIDNMYEYAFSEADLMKLLYATDTIEDFIVSAINKFVENYRNFFTSITPSDNEIKNRLSDLDITYNNKSVDVKETFYHNALTYVGE